MSMSGTGFIPASLGLMFYVDVKKINDGISFDSSLEGPGNYRMLEEAFKAISFGYLPPLYSGYDSLIPIAYNAGFLLIAVSPEVLWTKKSLAPHTSIKEYVKGIGYKHEVPEEMEWFYVKSIDVYTVDDDSIVAAPDAVVTAENYYTIPLSGAARYMEPFSYVSYRNGELVKTDGINERTQTVQGQINKRPVVPGADVSNSWPRNKFQNIWAAHSVSVPGYVNGIADSLSKPGTLLQYPDVNGLGQEIYNGNRLTKLSTTEADGVEFFKSPKLPYLVSQSHSSVKDDEFSFKNVNTIVSDMNLAWWPSHGVYGYTGKQYGLLYAMPMKGTSLARYINSYPKMSVSTPANRGLEYDVLKGRLTAATIGLGFIKPMLAMMGVTGFEKYKVKSGMALLNLSDSRLTGIYNKAATIWDLSRSTTWEFNFADVKGVNAIAEESSSWTLSIPQTSTLNTVKDTSIKERTDPFKTYSVEKLFKSVDEFYTWLNSSPIAVESNIDYRYPLFKVSVEPWMDTEYSKVWRLWGQRMHEAPFRSKRRNVKDVDILYR